MPNNPSVARRLFDMRCKLRDTEDFAAKTACHLPIYELEKELANSRYIRIITEGVIAGHDWDKVRERLVVEKSRHVG